MSGKTGSKTGASVLSNLTSQIESDMEASPTRTRPTPAPTQLMQFSEDFKAQAAELSKLKASHAAGFSAALSSLVDSPYHLLPIEESRVQALFDNLKENPLASPIVVRELKGTGKFEVLAGRHRVEAYRRLGRVEILAVLSELTDDESERIVFYDNLFAPSICDYEKYLGFSRRQKSKGFSHEELANEAGVSRSQVTHLFAFESLPEKARALIAENPKKASAALFVGLSPFSQTQPDKVVEVVSKVIDGRATVSSAISLMKAPPGGASRGPLVSEVYRKGHKPFATLNVRGLTLSVAFKSEAEVAATTEFLKKYLAEKVAGKT